MAVTYKAHDPHVSAYWFISLCTHQIQLNVCSASRNFPFYVYLINLSLVDFSKLWLS